MSTPDQKNAAVARAQFGDLGPNAAGAAGKEMNLNLILDVAVTLALEVGRTRMSVRDLLQLAPGAVDVDRSLAQSCNRIGRDTVEEFQSRVACGSAAAPEHRGPEGSAVFGFLDAALGGIEGARWKRARM